MSRKTPRAVFLGFLILTFLLTSGLGCKRSGEASKFPSVSLEMWGVFEDSEDINKLASFYTGVHPKVSITYRRFSQREYEEGDYLRRMLDGWVQGGGPDLFMIPVTRIREFQNYIEPMPDTMRAPIRYEQGTIKKETIEEVRTYNGYTPRQLRTLFLDTVSDDVVIDNEIYGLPYSVDTLSVFYNRELLKNSNIALPATNWNELLQQAAAISRADANDKIVQSAIALGTTNNIPNVLDIVSSLMMQVGITMADASGPRFQTYGESLNAIQFFQSFATKGLTSYSWSKDLPDAFDMFTAGRLAYFIGYPYHASMIRQANPKLDFDIIPMFRPENTTSIPTYASYWVVVVKKPPKTPSEQDKLKAELAWHFIFESTQAQNVKSFLYNPDRPRTTALRSLVEEQKNNEVLAPFAQYLLNAQNWYRGYDYELAKKYFLAMLDNIEAASAQPGVEPKSLVIAGADLITQTYQKPR